MIVPSLLITRTPFDSRTRVAKFEFPNEQVLEWRSSSAVPKGKANVVADALNRLSMRSNSHVEEGKKHLAQEVHRLARLGVFFLDSSEGGVVMMNGAKSSLMSQVKEK
ncbi:hypothetical protein MTR67_034622 [Solanum verrucosum]|uniref:Uncharacterized protein n=1 Tax=Solanum verrucosum TaxID=315347 RepID=A0AAF0ZJE9_SOLVR|nr:hypothetical protein MTR67_034622 [Solanum verrucosum]